MFERLFHEHGLPANIRSDNGVPFSSAHALFNLSRLAVWWLRLGIGIERIQPGQPHQNGRHERMHLTLKKEATKPAAPNFLQQQARFDRFLDIFNNERPHEALDMQCPAEVYRPSPRPYTGLPNIDYPLHDKTIVVTRCGRICLGSKKINFSQVFAGQAVGIKEVHDDIWLVSFMDYDLGYFDLEAKVLEPLDNPFGPKVLYLKALRRTNCRRANVIRPSAVTLAVPVGLPLECWLASVMVRVPVPSESYLRPHCWHEGVPKACRNHLIRASRAHNTSALTPS